MQGKIEAAISEVSWSFRAGITRAETGISENTTTMSLGIHEQKRPFISPDRYGQNSSGGWSLPAWPHSDGTTGEQPPEVSPISPFKNGSVTTPDERQPAMTAWESPRLRAERTGPKIESDGIHGGFASFSY
jgi:hypothetical protein